ncbi:unnamed protein product [Enterobius vermicularis]|uniref:DOMON domain-containing protein n=1 Tax=Enterobius vermicularis TaxID=51028 RepID=A0A0N4V1B1_ENTVE|nr:unnamed protein product [Enterobius vermicularis]
MMHLNNGPYILFLVILSLSVVADAVFNTNTCDLEKFCLSMPLNCQAQNICRQIFSYAPGIDGWVTIEAYDKSSDPMTNVLAVAFSDDEIMGDEPVTHCSFGEKPQIHFSYNSGKDNVQLFHENTEFEKNNLILLNATRDNGYLYCKFRQRIHPVGVNDFNFDLSKNATIFLMHTVAKDPKFIEIHSLDPTSEDFPVMFNETVNISDANAKLVTKPRRTIRMSKATKRKLILLHGFNSAKFQLHRILNVFSVLLMLLATAFIFIAVDLRWTGPTLKKSFFENLTARPSMHSLVG